jgi:hypothetical protein
MESCIDRLTNSGIAYSDAVALRRISITLHRWYAMECGDGNDYASWSISRGRKTAGVFEYDDDGKPYIERHAHTANQPTYTLIADRERGALKRLESIMRRYPAFSSYVQGDPRGASLYILRAGDVPAGASIESCYTNGIAVYK